MTKEEQQKRKEKQPKKPYAGIWSLICSIACVILSFPIAGAASGIAVYLLHSGYLK